MAKRPTLTDIAAAFASVSMLNDNYDAIEQAFDNTLSRDGSTPNEMLADLDMNGFDILNVGNIEHTADSVSRSVVEEYVADTRADVAGKSIDDSVNVIRTGGYTTIGDGGHALYMKTVPNAEPSHGFKVQSADGAWWEGIADTWGVSVHQFGATGDDDGDGTGTDDTTAIQAAIDYGTSKDVAVWFQKGKHYRVTNLEIEAETNLVMRSAGGMDPRGDTAATLVFTGTAGTTLLHLDGAEHATIEEISFIRYTTAEPDAYIKITNAAGAISTSVDLHKVLIRGQDKTDTAIGIDIGPGETVNCSDMNWGRLSLRKLGTGVRLNHGQVVGLHWEYIRAINCGTAIDIVDGGNLKIDTLNCTENDTDVKMRGGGLNNGTLIIDNAHVEWTSPSASAVFLDVESTSTGGVTVQLNNPIVQNNYTGTIIKVGQAARVISVGGHFPSGATISVLGTEDEGDAIFEMYGGRFDGTFSDNDFGYYAHYRPTVPLQSSTTSPFGGSETRTSGTKALGHDIEKMPAAQKRYFTMPLTRPSAGTVTRTIPDDAIVTGIDITIEDVGDADAADKVDIIVGGVTLGDIVVGTAGARHFGWAANDLDGSDTDTTTLGATAVLTGLDSTHTVVISTGGGTAADIKTATALVIVEYIVESVQALGIDP